MHLDVVRASAGGVVMCWVRPLLICVSLCWWVLRWEVRVFCDGSLCWIFAGGLLCCASCCVVWLVWCLM